MVRGVYPPHNISGPTTKKKNYVCLPLAENPLQKTVAATQISSEKRSTDVKKNGVRSINSSQSLNNKPKEAQNLKVRKQAMSSR